MCHTTIHCSGETKSRSKYVGSELSFNRWLGRNALVPLLGLSSEVGVCRSLPTVSLTRLRIEEAHIPRVSCGEVTRSFSIHMHSDNFVVVGEVG